MGDGIEQDLRIAWQIRLPQVVVVNIWLWAPARVRKTSLLLSTILTIGLAKTSVSGGGVVALLGNVVEGVVAVAVTAGTVVAITGDVVGFDRSTEPGVR
jgi:hypothetical protein